MNQVFQALCSKMGIIKSARHNSFKTFTLSSNLRSAAGVTRSTSSVVRQLPQRAAAEELNQLDTYPIRAGVILLGCLVLDKPFSDTKLLGQLCNELTNKVDGNLVSVGARPS